MLNKDEFKHGILCTDILISIIYGIIAVISAKFMAGISLTLSYPALLLVFVLGSFWAIIILIIIDKSIFYLSNKINFEIWLHIKSLIISAAFIFLSFDLIALKLTKSHLSIFTIKSILHEGFKEISGISSSTYYSGLSLLVILPPLFFLIVFNFQKKFHAYVRISRYLFLIFLFFFIPIERAVTAYYDYVQHDAIKIANVSILWRPRASSGTIFRKLLKDKIIKAAPLPYPLKIPIHNNSDQFNNLPHVIIVMAESLRADMVHPDIMPFLSHTEGTVFKNHYSTSNVTHFAIFSVLFGLFPNFYSSAVDLLSKPPLIELMENLGYNTHLISSNNFKWWKMDNLISHNYFDSFTVFSGNDWSLLDKKVVKEFKKLFSNLKPPQFFYLSLNSTHHNYSYPDTSEFNRFTPTLDKNTNLLLIDKSKAKLILNRYKNSAYYIDRLVSEIIDHIKNQDAWNNTLFIFLGDHGEEFFEEGHLLHSTRLNYYQTSAALFIHRPQDKTHVDITNKTSSHLDIIPTIIKIIELSGVRLIYPKWLKGCDLFSECLSDERIVYSASAAPKEPSIFAFHQRRSVCYSRRDQVISVRCKEIIKKGLDGFFDLEK